MNWTLDSVNEDNFFEFKSFFDLHVINKKIHIFGSTEKNSKETEIISNTKSFDHLGYYDTEEKKWKLNKTRNEESPIARKDYASALHYNAKEKKYFLFVHGGTFNAFKSDELYFQTFENGSIFLHDFYRYDFEQNQWTELDSVIVERRGHSAVVTKDNRMIFFGGRLEFENGELSNNLFIFNIETQEWETIPCLCPSVHDSMPNREKENVYEQSSLDLNVPEARERHSAVWMQSSQMVIYSGMETKNRVLSDA